MTSIHGKALGKKHKGFGFWRCQSTWHQNYSSAHSGHEFMNSVRAHKRTSDFSCWRNEDSRMVYSKMCLPLELAMFVELPFLITALTGANTQLWQLCTITNFATMGVKGHMSRGNQVGLEKISIPIHLKCSCMASGGPDFNFKSVAWLLEDLTSILNREKKRKKKIKVKC